MQAPSRTSLRSSDLRPKLRLGEVFHTWLCRPSTCHRIHETETLKLKMSCHPDHIPAYLDDLLSPQDEVALEQHLNVCDECRQQLADSAGSGDDWSAVATALRPDAFDEDVEPVNAAPAWPLALLGPTDDPRMLGRIGPFEVSGCVGVGGMGVVFKARDPALDRFVAVKVLSPQLAASESARIRFAREAKAAAVVHDNVIAVYQVAEYQSLPYLVMPYLPGPSLEERLKRFGALAPLEALRVARQVAAGLQAAHAQGLIHRDIKPANILLSGDTERAVITDFGLARAVDDATLTRSGSLAGTPQFMAPEQARGEPTDSRSDLFSVGALLFAMLTGRPPVAELSGTETVRKVGHLPPPKLTSLLDDVPGWLSQLVESLHSFDAAKRLPNAAAAEKRLTAAMSKASGTPLRRRDGTAASESRAAGAANMKRASVWAASVAVALLSVWAVRLCWPPMEVGHPKDAVPVLQAVVSPPELDQLMRKHLHAAPVADGSMIIESTPVVETPVQSKRQNVSPQVTDLDGHELDGLLQMIESDLERLENR